MKNRMISLAMIVAVLIGMALSVCASCNASQTDNDTERYVHHEYLYGTARIDYVEVADGDNLVTHYYKYANPANQFLVTSVEVYSGSRYIAPRLLRIVRYEYNAQKKVIGKTVEYGPADTPATIALTSVRENGNRGARTFEKISSVVSPPTIDLAARR